MDTVLMEAERSVEFLTFRLGDEEYAIDILQVREIRAPEPITALAGAPAFVRGVINLRGAIVPVLDLRAKLGMPRAVDNGVTIIVSLFGRLTGVMVDAVSDVCAISRRDVRDAPEMDAALPLRFIRGIAPVDGRMLVLVDLGELIGASGTASGVAEAA